MAQQTVVQSGGVGFLGLMFLIFMTLKLTGYITWSWWWVTAPLWGPPVLLISLFVIVFFMAYIGELIKR